MMTSETKVYVLRRPRELRRSVRSFRLAFFDAVRMSIVYMLLGKVCTNER